MSAYPIVLEGSVISALVVGGGRVAARKAQALVDAGADVRVVAPAIGEEMQRLAKQRDGIRISLEIYTRAHLDDATLVVAATDDPAVNATVAADARAQGRLVNVADHPELGDFVTPAVHRQGELVVAVTTGGVPIAAARIRNALGRTFDERYAVAVRDLAGLRRALVTAGHRDRWAAASAALIGDDFCERVESGTLAAELDAWR